MLFQTVNILYTVNASKNHTLSNLISCFVSLYFPHTFFLFKYSKILVIEYFFNVLGYAIEEIFQMYDIPRFQKSLTV